MTNLRRSQNQQPEEEDDYEEEEEEQEEEEETKDNLRDRNLNYLNQRIRSRELQRNAPMDDSFEMRGYSS